jgi:uncharacterized membrane protein
MGGEDDLHRHMVRRATETGLLIAATAMPETFQRTLIPRSNLDQAIVSGLAFTMAQGLVSTIQEVLQSLALPAGDEVDSRRWHRRALGVDLAALATGAAIGLLLPEDDDEHVAVSTIRTGGWMVAVTGLGGLLTGLAHELGGRHDPDQGGSARWELLATAAAVAALREFGRRRRDVLDEGIEDAGTDVQALRALALGAGVGLGATGLARVEAAITRTVTANLARVLPGGPAPWRPVGHLASLGTFAAAGYALARPIYRSIEESNTRFETALDVAPVRDELSGSRDSLVPYDTMGKMGRRMVWTLRAPDEIERVMGEEAAAVPIRVYGGLALADSIEERVERVLDELERTGALDRRWLLVISPTGTGYPNYAALGAFEFLTRGDCASVAMQYSARPSPLSVDRVGHGRAQFRALVDRLQDRVAARATRPTVVVFGESLGAWTSQDAFLHRGTDGLVEAGIDHALWIGTPFGSKWKDQVVGGGRDDVDDRLWRVVGSVAEWDALDPATRADLRYVMLTHHDDAVAWFDEKLLVKRPSWLGPPEDRPAVVPRSQRWIPITTFLQTLIDMKNAAQVVPGVFESRGHDYRADLAPMLAGLLDLPVTPAQQQAVRRALEAEEAMRTRWIDEHGEVGASMAVTLLRRIREESPEAFEAALRSVRSDTAGWMAEWEAHGGA